MLMTETNKSYNVVLNNIIDIANKISKISTFNSFIKTQCYDLSRRITFLIPLIQHLLDNNDVVFVVPYQALVLLQQAILSAKDLLLFCSQSSKLFMILEREKIECKFTHLASQFEQAIREISYDKLDISEDLKEQVALLTAQFRRAKENFDPPGVEVYEHLLSIYNKSSDVNTETAALRLICDKLQFVSLEDIKHESRALHKMIVDGGRWFEKSTEGLSTVLKRIEDFLLKESENIATFTSEDLQLLSHSNRPCMKLRCESPVVPEEFRCPISHELMKDPVTISTGQTYDRACIKKWFDAGNQTCPKTRQIISSSILKDNNVLYLRILTWCKKNGVEPPTRLRNFRICIERSDGSSELIDLDSLKRKLTSGCIEEQRCATGDLILFAKHDQVFQKSFAEAGIIPLLVDLLYIHDAGTQENAVTALLNISIYEENKQRIMASKEAVQGILHVLKNGNREARKNAANTFCSLSAVDDNKRVISSSGAIEALITLFCEGSKSGKTEAAKALFKLCLYQGNTERAIKAGIVPKLIEILTEPGGEMQDEALIIMLLIVRHQDGNAAIRPMKTISTLVELISNGSSVNKENATDVLVYLCRGDPVHVPIVASLGVINPLLELEENGSEWGKRKAEKLLKLLST